MKNNFTIHKETTKHWKYRATSIDLTVIHCLSVHPEGWCKNYKNQTIRAFKTIDEAIHFMKQNIYQVSCDVIILPNGDRIEFEPENPEEKDFRFNHCRGYNSISRGVECIRLASLEHDKQYSDDLYESLNEQLKIWDKPYATHEQLNPVGKTDPDFMDLSKIDCEKYEKI